MQDVMSEMEQRGVVVKFKHRQSKLFVPQGRELGYVLNNRLLSLKMHPVGALVEPTVLAILSINARLVAACSHPFLFNDNHILSV